MKHIKINNSGIDDSIKAFKGNDVPNAITYPSTFIIDPTGKIKYGVNAAIEWDDPEFIEKIKSLL